MQPSVQLNNGVAIPMVGLGVMQASTDTIEAVDFALRSGYRLIDNAATYGNEREVGEGIRQSGVPREDLFITTKVWISDYSRAGARKAFEVSSRKLGVDYLDLLILHQPMPTRWDATVDAYRGLEDLLADGRVRAIGVSNFMLHHLEKLVESVDVVPAVNQIEVHPFFAQAAVTEANARHGIFTQAWSPIGGVNLYWEHEDDLERGNPLEDPVIAGLAAEYGKTPAQIILNWHLQRGRGMIPKSTRRERLLENLSIGDFEMTGAQLDSIDALDTGVRGGPDPEIVDTELYDFTIPDE